MSRDRKVREPKVVNLHNDFVPDWHCMVDTVPRNQEWFWDQLIPDETSTIFAGSGGIGKSLVLLNIAANTTTGAEFNCCGYKVKLPKGSVILMSAEGQDSIHVVPKLIAMGADLNKIYSIVYKVSQSSKKAKLLQLDKELSIIEEKVKELQCSENPVKLIIVDPIGYFMGDTKDYIPQEVAELIASFNRLADKYKLAFIFNKHRRKQSSGQSFSSLADEVGGTAAWINSPRQALGFIKHPKEENVFLMGQIKSNLVKSTEKSFNYTIHDARIYHNGKVINTSKLLWGEKMISIGINDASSTDAYEKTKTQQTSDIIFNYLKENGDTQIKKINELCDAAGINSRMRQRVIKKMKHDGEIEDAEPNILPHLRLKPGY